jgi:hypothetical protein
MQELSDMQSEKIEIQYSRVNSLMNMIAVPYLGVYSPNYTFMMPINVLHKKQISNGSFELFPDTLKRHLADLNKGIELDHFMITLDGNYLYSKHNNIDFLRMNLVPHPYIFYDITDLGKDHYTYVFSCLYSEDPFHASYLRETIESDGLRINPEVFLSDQNKKEIILHKSNDNFPAISPNNCSFLVNINKNFFTFYNLTAVTYMNKFVKFAVVQFNVFNHNDILALSPLLESFNSVQLQSMGLINIFISNIYYAKENIKHIFHALYVHLLKNLKIENEKEFNRLELCRNLFNSIYYRKISDFEDNLNYIISDSSDVTESKKITDFHYDSLCYFIWCNMGKFKIAGLGEKVINSSYPLYFMEIIRKYMNYILKGFDLLFSTFKAFFKDAVENHNIKLNGNKNDNNFFNNPLVDENILELQFTHNKSI